MTQRNAKLIAHDAANVFPELGLFGPGEEVPGKSSEPGPYHASLLNVINAHASLAPTEPYENRAIGSLAGVLLLHMDEQDAFLTLQGLLSRPVHAAFALSTPQASSYLKAFNLAFSERLPRVKIRPSRLKQLAVQTFPAGSAKVRDVLHLLVSIPRFSPNLEG